MLPLEAIAQIKAEIERLERLRKECTDTGIRNRIGTWIEAEKTKIASDPSKEARSLSGIDSAKASNITAFPEGVGA
jgi:hypothetical protein